MYRKLDGHRGRVWLAALVAVLFGGGLLAIEVRSAERVVQIGDLISCVEEAGFSIQRFDLRSFGGLEGFDIVDGRRTLVEVFVASSEERAEHGVDSLLIDDGIGSRIANVVYQRQAPNTELAEERLRDCAELSAK